MALVEPHATEWNTFTQQHPYGHLLQSTPWGELKQTVGWTARRILVVGSQGALAGAQMLFRQRFGLSVAYVPRGPLLAQDAAANELLLRGLDRIARRARAVFLRLEPNVLEDSVYARELHSLFLRHDFRTADPIQPHSTVQLDVTPTPEQLLTAMSKGHRADIRRATRDGVTVRVGSSSADFDAFYTTFQATAQRAEFAIHSYAYYHAAWDLFRSASGQVEHTRLLLAERDNEVLAAFLIFAWAGAGLYLYSCSTEVGLKSGANHLLQWHALEWARAQGCRIYDFWGVPDQFGQAATMPDVAGRVQLETAAKNDPLYGVFRFKKGFGGRVVRFVPAYDRVYLPPLYALWQRRVGG